ncbi:delta serrate ligand, partial [Teladorsagia circumcincta]
LRFEACIIYHKFDIAGYQDFIRERFLVDGSLPVRTVTTVAEFLEIEFHITCDQNYFGLRCDRFCKTDDKSHLTCSQNGEKICRLGWTGENCSRIEEHGGGRLIISRLVSPNHNFDMFSFTKKYAGEHAFIFSVAVFFTLFIGFTLYLLNS